MRRGGALLIGLGLLAACGRDALPPEITIEQVVTELGPPLATDVRVEGPGAAGVHRGVLGPGERASGGGPLEAVVTPEPTTLHFQVTVPSDTTLRFAAGVDGDKKRDLARSGVEFRVAVDGREVFSRTVNPAAWRKDRRWIEGRVALQPWAGRSVDLVLETRAERAGRPLAGTAGWSHIRLVREEHRKREQGGTAPNVLLLLVDTLRADRLGIYGADRSASPALDRFAGGGLVFDVAVAQASWTMPAVASVFTGLHPRSHGAVGSVAHMTDDAPGGTLLPDGVVTLAELAEQVGVTTFGVSTNGIVGRDTNMAQGFETFVQLPFDPKARDYAPASMANQVFLDWLARAPDVRFFAYLHYMDPHGPYAPPPALRPPPPEGMRPDIATGWIQDYAQAVNEGRAPPPSRPELDYLRRLYAGDVRSWDDALAAFLRTLEARGALEHTIVVVMADHGEEFMEHGNLAHGGHLYEETVRIPLVIVGPGVPSGRRPDMAQGVDLLPTIASILGAPVPAGLAGRDLLATHSAGDAVSEIVAGFGDGNQGGGTVALRTPRWKLIRSADGNETELYDLVNDPEEHTNLAATSPETAALVARLDRWAAGAPPPPHTGATDPTLRAKLRQLGYVE